MSVNLRQRLGNKWLCFERDIKSLKSDLVADFRGVAIIETAFALPLLLLIGLGGMELAHFVITHSRVSQAALGVADNASRIGGTTGQVREIDINEVFTGAVLQTAGMDWSSNGRIILSSLEQRTVNGTVQQWIHWQRCFGGLAANSSFGLTGVDVGATGMGPVGRKVLAGADTAIMFVEVVYLYRPILAPATIGEQRIHYTAAFNVREARDLEAGTNKSGVVATPGVTPSSCT
jgi:hypothetical protein